MSVFEIIIGAFILILSILIIAVVILQQGSRGGVNTVVSGGSSDTFLSKNKSRTRDARLSRITKIIAIAFFVFALIANAITMTK